MTAQPETHAFATKARQLLSLMIHSLYSNREIFLRELISNASDAIDKLRFKSISEPDLVGDDNDYRIRIAFDKEAKTITVEDNGIGMTRQEVIDNLGTIAQSGTAEFLQRLSGDDQKDANLIGQFGVGFYSAFIVAQEVEVLTRSAGAEAGVRWRSKGEDDFTVEEADAPRGAQVILHLRDDALEFADGFRLRHVVRKYSDHIGVPVCMAKEVVEAAEDGEDSEDAKSGKGGKDEPPAPEWEAVNEAKALWTRSRSDISDDEYREFYKHSSHDFQDPLAWSHNKVEGRLEYVSLLYIPKRAPFDLWNRESPRGLKLYVQRVFIMDNAEQFLPLYLRFVKGVVDSDDLPLNVSRELLQEDERVGGIRSALTKRALTTLENMAKNAPEDYRAFWREFGEVLKEGAGEDFANREQLCKLLRFSSTASEGPDPSVSLADYAERMVEKQERIYYLVADSHDNARSNPHLEVFRERGVEVLLLFNRIDEWLMSNLSEFDGKSFQDVTRAGLVLPGEEEKQDEAGDSADDEAKDGAEEEPLAERIKGALGDRVDSVRRSSRLTDSPVCLVQGEFALGRQMQRIMEAAGQAVPPTKPSFEYNAEHPLLQRLDRESDEDRFAELVLVLFDQATLAEGDALPDAAAYVGRINRLLLELLDP